MSNSNRMISPRDDALFSIGTVTDITGISEAALRVWERRYQFPQTARTSGRHRLYGQDDVMQLQWVKIHIDEGMRAGHAIRARRLIDRATAVTTTLRKSLPPCDAPEPASAEISSTLLQALLAYDGSKAAMSLKQATDRYPLDRVVLDIIGPTLSAIGEAWSLGEAAVVTEHFATNVLRHQLLEWIQTSPTPYEVSPVVLACAPEELHEGGLLMLAVLLRQLRWPVIYLGQSLPLSDLAALVDHAHPALIVFGAMRESSALALADWPQWLTLPIEVQTLTPIIGYGGRAFTENPTLANHIPGVFLGASLGEGSKRIHRLMLDLNVLSEH